MAQVEIKFVGGSWDGEEGIFEVETLKDVYIVPKHAQRFKGDIHGFNADEPMPDEYEGEIYDLNFRHLETGKLLKGDEEVEDEQVELILLSEFMKPNYA